VWVLKNYKSQIEVPYQGSSPTSKSKNCFREKLNAWKTEDSVANKKTVFLLSLHPAKLFS
jgi:hypothetical protein